MSQSRAVLTVAFVVVSTVFASVGSDSELDIEIRPLEKIHVSIINNLGDELVLWVHCKSKDDDLGDQFVNDGDMYTFEFRVNAWGTTQFFCTVKYKGQKILQFDVFRYWRDHRKCIDKCLWRMTQDGVYQLNEINAQWVLKYRWPNPG